ncbi:MAG: transposase [Ferruginibacter sp.]
MPINEKYLAPFECEGIYHDYNRTNNKEILFRSDSNYQYFLNQYAKYFSPFVGTYAWNLLPNHFHFLIRIKREEEILKYISTLPKQTVSEQTFLIDKNIDVLMEMEFKRFFTSFAMAFNIMFTRVGNLFARTFKRVKIDKDSQFTQALIYIHANARKHRLVKMFDEYKWTSYHSIISEKPTMLLRDEIIDWFGNKEEFIA